MADPRTTLIVTFENEILSLHIADSFAASQDSNTRNDARHGKKIIVDIM